jgi:hypothetical protein
MDISYNDGDSKILNGSTLKGVKFELYSPRKGIIDEKGSKVVSYIEPTTYRLPNKRNSKKLLTVKGFSLSKMKGRDPNEMVNKNNFPSPCSYTPSYNYIKGRGATSKILHLI